MCSMTVICELKISRICRKVFHSLYKMHGSLREVIALHTTNFNSDSNACSSLQVSRVYFGLDANAYTNIVVGQYTACEYERG